MMTSYDDSPRSDEDADRERSEYLAECKRLDAAVTAAYESPWREREEAVRIATEAFIAHVNTRPHGCALCGATDLRVGVQHKCEETLHDVPSS